MGEKGEPAFRVIHENPRIGFEPSCERSLTNIANQLDRIILADSFLTRSRPAFALFSKPQSILAMVSIAHATNHAYSTLMPLIYPIVVNEFGFSYTEIGIMVGVGSAASGLLQMTFGSLRRYVARRFWLGGGQVVMGISTALTSIASNFGFFFATNTAARIGGSPQHPVGSSILSDTFAQERRGFALSAHVSGGNIGTVAVPLIGTFIIATLGWRAALLIFAIIAAAVGVLIIFTLDESTAEHADAPSTGTHGSWAKIKTIFASRNIQFIFITSIIAAGGRGLGVLITWIPIYLQNGLGIDPAYSGILFTLLLIGSVVGPLMLGRISDRYGRRPLLIATYVLAMALTIYFTTLNGKEIWMPLTLLAMGIIVYAESPLLQAALADSTEGLDRDFTFALYYTATFGIGALWASALGWVIDTYGYTMGFYTMTASYILSAFAVLPIHDARMAREK